jgi:hypothetical protein
MECNPKDSGLGTLLDLDGQSYWIGKKSLKPSGIALWLFGDWAKYAENIYPKESRFISRGSCKLDPGKKTNKSVIPGLIGKIQPLKTKLL